MKPLDAAAVQEAIERHKGQDVYIHLEITNGAYASHFGGGSYSAGGYIRNARVRYEQGKITGEGPYRVGLKLDIGWIYAEGLSHFELTENDDLLLAGLGEDGKLAVALEISRTPFE
ncbi:MAG: YojF family protein [Bacillus sp. (in: firmicutes)]